ncbi:hypothetical protein T02_10940 [Trichinella nativa]|uniref:Uncharacterized protein n=1 Tax=Trichinella nativa TaxID=6335 RepID=A0A0V1LDR3_9BILA|nr:hypothetical protein T02_10940 [Trichinella nativa]
MPPANLKKYLPSGYTPGYASGKISVKFKNFQNNSRRLRPRLRFRQFQRNIYPQGTHGATPPAKFFVIFEEIAPDYALRSAWSPLP